MADYSENLKTMLSQLLAQYKITEVELSRRINIPIATINRLTNKRTPDPRTSTLKAIADYFNITVDDLVGQDNVNARFNTRVVKSTLLSDLKDLFKANKEKYLKEGNETVIKLDNDAMAPIFTDTTHLVFEQTKELRNREFVLVYLKNKDSIIFRQLLTDADMRILIPINTNFSNITMTDEDIILGKLVKSVKDY